MIPFAVVRMLASKRWGEGFLKPYSDLVLSDLVDWESRRIPRTHANELTDPLPGVVAQLDEAQKWGLEPSPLVPKRVEEGSEKPAVLTREDMHSDYDFAESDGSTVRQILYKPLTLQTPEGARIVNLFAKVDFITRTFLLFAVMIAVFGILLDAYITAEGAIAHAREM